MLSRCTQENRHLSLFLSLLWITETFRLQLWHQQTPERTHHATGEQEQVHTLIWRCFHNKLSPVVLDFNLSKCINDNTVSFCDFREILLEIQRLRAEHEQACQPTPERVQQNPTLLAELRQLRWRIPFLSHFKIFFIVFRYYFGSAADRTKKVLNIYKWIHFVSG